jgi:hypothetical protein
LGDKITYWTEINFEPVQTISEFRNGENLLPFNFTVDSNLDPFIVIDVTSDNGYGSIYRDSKNYEIRGLRYNRSTIISWVCGSISAYNIYIDLKIYKIKTLWFNKGFLFYNNFLCTSSKSIACCWLTTSCHTFFKCCCPISNITW